MPNPDQPRPDPVDDTAACSPRPVCLQPQGGFVAGSESLVFGCLIFVVGTLLVVNAWGVVDARMTADAVARQVARTLVEADPDDGLGADLRSVAAGVADQMGRPTAVTLGYRDAGGSAVTDPAKLLVRCQRVTVTATLATSTVHLPFVDNDWGPPWQVTGTHTEVVDPFRSGLPGEADCRG